MDKPGNCFAFLHDHQKGLFWTHSPPVPLSNRHLIGAHLKWGTIIMLDVAKKLSHREEGVKIQLTEEVLYGNHPAWEV